MRRPAVADYPPGARLPPRVIDDFEFVWMLRGHARFVASESEEVSLTPGQLLLVPPGVRHGFVWDRTRPSRHGYVHFGLDDLRADVPAEVRLLRMTSEDPLTGLCAYLLWLGAGEHDGWQHQARRTLEFMLALVQSGPLPDTEPPATLAPPLRAAITYLHQQWSHLPLRRIGVEELATAAHWNLRGIAQRLPRRAEPDTLSAGPPRRSPTQSPPVGMTTSETAERPTCVQWRENEEWSKVRRQALSST